MDTIDENIIRCKVCGNQPDYRRTCTACHYSGFMLKDGQPATVKLGETDKWIRREKSEQRQRERKAEKYKDRAKFNWRGNGYLGGKIIGDKKRFG